MRKNILSAVAATALALGLAPPAGAAEFTPDAAGNAISIDGEIVAGDDGRLLALVGELNRQGHRVEGVLLNSPGGEIIAGEGLAAAIYGLRVGTAVPHGAVCASICVLVFAAGWERYAYEDSWLGVHSVWMARNEQSDEAAPEDLDSLGFTTAIARDMAAYGVPAAVITKMLTTHGTDMAWLNADHVAGWVTVLPAAGAAR